ncbi:MAG: hypothetical protein EZS28_053071, partial [Streblomastix strix]
SEYFNLLEIPPLNEQQDESAESFRSIPADIIPNLKSLQIIDSGVEKCQEINSALSEVDFQLVGASIYIYYKENIIPSFSQLIWKYPKRTIVKNGDNTEEWLDKGCLEDFKQYIISLEEKGIVSDQCITNDIILPHHDEADDDMVMPPHPTQCTDPQIPFTHYLQGFRFGFAQGLNNEQLKQYISRVGAFNGYIFYFNAKGNQIGNSYSGLFIGWEKVDDQQYWIVIEKQLDDG